MHKYALALLATLAPIAATPAQSRYTPTEFTIILFEVDISTNGQDWVDVFDNGSGLQVDLTDPNAFANAFAQAAEIPAGTYPWIRMTLSNDLEWSHPAAPVSLSNQITTVNGPPGPQAGQMTAYFATEAEGGQPNGSGGGDGTIGNPLLMGSAAEIVADSNTVLRIVFSVTDTLVDQGGGSYDLGPPRMFFVSENDSASGLSGVFNAVFYNATKEIGGSGPDQWSFMSGHGVLTFDGAGSWSWTGETNDYDLLTTSGALNSSASYSGRYGLNQDGSFWMLTLGEPGTLHGAISSDGEILLASMYDSPAAHMMIFGVERASSANIATFNSGYYFTLYGTNYNNGSTLLEYRGSFGVVNGNGVGGIAGTDDTNRLLVTDPNGTPSITPSATSLAQALSDTVSVTSNGELSNATDSIAGGLLESGDVGCIGSDFSSPYQSSHDFGFFVRQSAANTFTAASLNGTYFGGHFGDRHETGPNTSEFFSGFFRITFDGVGMAALQIAENREGDLQTETTTTQYVVDPATGIVTFPENGVVNIKGAIGPGAQSFILTAAADVQGSPNDQRFLGLGLKQQ